MKAAYFALGFILCFLVAWAAARPVVNLAIEHGKRQAFEALKDDVRWIEDRYVR